MTIHNKIINTTNESIELLRSSLGDVDDLLEELSDKVDKIEDNEQLLNLTALLRQSLASLQQIEGQLLYAFMMEPLKKALDTKSNIIKLVEKDEDD